MKKLLLTNKDREEFKTLLRNLFTGYSSAKEFEMVLDTFIDNCHKVIYITYSKFVAFKEWEECHSQTSDFNYCKLHCEQMDEENLILPQCKFRLFERRDGKFYSLISGLEYVGDLKKDCNNNLIKYDFLKNLGPKC